MSVSDRTLAFAADTVRARTVSRLVTGLLQRFAFWLAVVLPFAYLPLLATGFDSETTILAFVGLVAVHVCALVCGHAHGAGRY